MAPTIQRHTLAYAPLGLWQFNETLNDTSGNAYHFTVEVGQERYTDIFPGVRGILLEGTRLYYNVAQAALRITGDVTVETLIRFFTPAASLDSFILTHYGTGEAAGGNCLFSLDLAAVTGQLGFFSESASGVNSAYVISDVMPQGSLCHVAMTRTSNVVQFYLNGLPFGAPSGTLTTPTDGTSGRLRVGHEESGAFGPNSIMASLKLLNISLSASQIAAEYNRTLGLVYGLV